MSGGSTSKELKCLSKVVIWDNKEKRMVLRGTVNVSQSSSFIPVITMSTWTNLTEEYVEELFEESPFEKE